MKFCKTHICTYLVLEPEEWTDDIGISDLANKAVAAQEIVNAKVRIVAFMIAKKLKVAVAVFPSDQDEPTEEQVMRLYTTCARPDYPGMDSVTVTSMMSPN